MIHALLAPRRVHLVGQVVGRKFSHGVDPQNHQAPI